MTDIQNDTKPEETRVTVSAADVYAVMFGGQHPGYRLAERDGKTVGIQIGSVSEGSAAARLGARSNDVVEAVNGVELSSWSAASAVEATTRDQRTFEVRVRRDGKPVRLVLEVIGGS